LYKGYNSVGVGESLYFPSKVEMIKALPDLIKENDNVLVKASNAMKFWELLPTLEEL
jgi:UDP-N-acetylmuramoyl-tripeptide--D-alanyl-D-alanine ligase